MNVNAVSRLRTAIGQIIILLSLFKRIKGKDD